VAERGLPLHVIVGSEVKTATGEVIGLYLQEDIPRGMPFADTIEAIRAQGAVVYVPHPFDRLHSIPDPALLRRLADQIDVLETCNGRLYREAYNREAERFAERYDLLAGAGSDAHVPEGLATACVELPPFADAESLLLALAQGKIVRRPANLVYLQGLKWLRSARSRTPGAER
jgi:predicted metal-dependent phosphoesterase TrpH